MLRQFAARQFVTFPTLSVSFKFCRTLQRMIFVVEMRMPVMKDWPSSLKLVRAGCRSNAGGNHAPNFIRTRNAMQLLSLVSAAEELSKQEISCYSRHMPVSEVGLRGRSAYKQYGFSGRRRRIEA